MRQLAKVIALGAAAAAASPMGVAYAQGAPTLLVPGVAVDAGPTVDSASAVDTNPVVDRLLQNARHNIRSGRADLALGQLDRIDATDPNNAEAMMLRVVALASASKQAEAQAALQRLRAAHPADVERISVAQKSLETGGRSGVGNVAAESGIGDPADSRVDAARAAAAAGRYDEAVRNYRASFGADGTPPPEIAQEFYETLAGSSSGISEAREGLRRLYETRRDPATALSYARVLTYRESTRRRGIDLLEQLSNDPDPRVATAATDAWAQALTWLTPSRSDADRYDRYIARFPDDVAVQRAKTRTRRAVASAGAAGPRDRFGEARARGFRLLNRGDLSGARRQFEIALRGNRRDSDALGGLGVISLRQGDFERAKDYLSRATSRSRRARSRWGEALASAEFWSSYRRAEALRDQGDYARSAEIARSLVGQRGADAKSVQQLLGDSLIGLGRYDEAETAFRRALDVAPNDAGAQLGVFNALLGQRRFEEAAAYSQTMTADAQGRISDIAGLRASALRVRAMQSLQNGDSQTAFAQLKEALSIAPEDPWIRLDYARLLAASGAVAEADSVIAPMATAGDATALQAAAVYYDEQGRVGEAAAIAQRIPPESQTAETRALIDRLAYANEIARADALAEAGRRPEAIAVLQGLAGRAETPGQQAQIAGALASLGAPHQALRLIQDRIAAAGGLESDPDLQILYAGALAQTGAEAEAAAVLNRVQATGGLTARQQADAADVRRGLVIRQADRARTRGAHAAAYNYLYPELATAPNDPELLSALARIYASAGRLAQAQAIYAEVLERDPSNIDAVRGAVGAAIQAKDIQTATLLLDQAVKVRPDDPHIYFLIGEAARARGDRRTAIRAFETARTLRQRELQARVGDGPAGDGLPDNPFAGPAAAGGQPLFQPAPQAPVFAPIEPARPANPFAQPGTSGAFAVPGDPADDKLFAQTYTGGDNAAYDRTGSDNAVFRTYAPGAAPEYVAPRSDGGFAPSFVNPAEQVSYSEPTLTEQIDTRLRELEGDRGHFVQAGVALRARDGEAGLDRLTEAQTPISYTFKPRSFGAITLTATPVFVSAGNISGGEGQQRRFGTNPIAPTGGVPTPGEVEDSGVGLNAAFDADIVRADIGVTPLGFERINPVGGVTFAPRLNQDVTLTFTLEQRAITDSVLSYAGVEDDRTGYNFGGVVRRGGTVGGSIDIGEYGAYASGGYYEIRGDDVQDNDMFELTVGAYSRVINEPDEELKIGGNLTFLSYDRNLRYFTFGHGGYFSPQSYVSISAPIEYTRQKGRATYQIGGAIGLQRFDESDAPVFPGSARETGQLNRAIARGTLGASALTNYPGQEETSIGFNIYGRMEYAVTDRSTIGAGGRLDSAADWFEGSAFVYLRQSLGGALYVGRRN